MLDLYVEIRRQSVCKVKSIKRYLREREAKRMSPSVKKMIVVEWNCFLKVKLLIELGEQTDFFRY